MRLRNLLEFNVVSIVACLALGACADTSWEAARRTDTVASYHQFLRDHPDSPKEGEAQERIGLLRVHARPTMDAVEAFESEFPQSELVTDLRAEVEPLYFDRARAANTSDAYREFLARFPSGKLSDRARGNLDWVEHTGQHGSTEGLRDFARAHPESDFAPEAQRSLELLEAYRETSFRTLGIRIDVAPDVAETERVARGFAALAASAYRDLGVEVTLIPSGTNPSSALEAWMRIDYAEIPAPGTFGRGSMISDCRVRIYHRNETEPVWDRRFQTPADHLARGARGRDKTVFGNGRYSFWREFFVPTATWATSRTRIHRIDYEEPVAAVDVLGDRAAVLLRSGTTDYLDVASPLEPVRLQRYRHGRDLARWKGLRLLPGDRAALFGPSGLELVQFDSQAGHRLGRWETSEIGAIRAAELHGETLLVAGNKGVFGVRINREPLAPHRLLDGEWVGLAKRDGAIWLVAPSELTVASPAQLLRHVTGPRTALRQTFRAEGARLVGSSLWVFGKDQVVQFELGDQPVPVAKLEAEHFGRIVDVSAGAGHLYLLGERGLQIASPSGSWVSDLIQVSADQGMSSKGRFLLLAGQQSFEVLDLSPYGEAAPASPAP